MSIHLVAVPSGLAVNIVSRVSINVSLDVKCEKDLETYLAKHTLPSTSIASVSLYNPTVRPTGWAKYPNSWLWVLHRFPRTITKEEYYAYRSILILGKPSINEYIAEETQGLMFTKEVANILNKTNLKAVGGRRVNIYIVEQGG